MSGNLLALLRELSQRDIEYIVVGGMAGVLHGAPVVTADLDIVHRRTQQNVAKLLALLNELDAIFRGDDRRLKPNESHLLGRGHVLLTTRLGQLDVLCEVSEQAYEELEPFTDSMSLGDPLNVKVVGLEKLIELKTAAGRPISAQVPASGHVVRSWCAEEGLRPSLRAPRSALGSSPLLVHHAPRRGKLSAPSRPASALGRRETAGLHVSLVNPSDSKPHTHEWYSNGTPPPRPCHSCSCSR